MCLYFNTFLLFYHTLFIGLNINVSNCKESDIRTFKNYNQDTFNNYIHTESKDEELVQDEAKDSNQFDFAHDEEIFQKVSYALDTEKLVELAIVENDLYYKLKNKYVNVTGRTVLKNLASLQLYLEDYEQTSLNATKHLKPSAKLEKGWIISTNPILMYKMIRRCAEDLSKIKTELEKYPEQFYDILKEIRIIDWTISLPTEFDVFEAIEGLLRIQDLYDFQLDKFVQGQIGDFETQAILTGNDCLKIGKYALEKQQYTMAIEWLEIGRQIAFPGTDFAIKGFLAKYLTTAKIYHDEVWEEWKHEKLIRDLMSRNNLDAITENQNMITLEDIFDRKVSDKSKPGKRVKASTLLRRTATGIRTQASSHLESLNICVGKNFQTKEEKSHLKCWLDSKSNCYWRINPLKTELLHANPEVIQFHDFVGDKMIGILKSLSVPRLKRSGVINYEKFGTDFSNTRTSLNSWIYDTPLLNPFYNKIELATRLQVKRFGSSQALQVVDYSALGSQYQVHHDAMSDPKLIKDHGDRIATFMLYLNDVEMGGSTSFPMLGTAAKPLKGSAIFWYNFFKNGTEDSRARHCGCPVILGRKLIANKWIMANENMFNKPCNLNRND